jgi:hypothetical protein
MGRKWRACRVVSLALTILAAPDTGAHEASGNELFRVRLSRPGESMAVRAALRGAMKRIDRQECRLILTDFTDDRGRKLQQNLESLGLSGPEYLTFILFREGDPRECARGHVLAFTTPGSRVVFVCSQLAETQRRDTVLAEAMVIHEALHTLGLSEDPPSSQEITRRVLARCGP